MIVRVPDTRSLLIVVMKKAPQFHNIVDYLLGRFAGIPLTKISGKLCRPIGFIGEPAIRIIDNVSNCGQQQCPVLVRTPEASNLTHLNIGIPTSIRQVTGHGFLQRRMNAGSEDIAVMHDRALHMCLK